MSYDFGATFTARNETDNQLWSGVATSGIGEVWLALTSDGKLFKSEDFGVTWTFLPITNFNTYATGLVWEHIAANGDFSAVYVTSSVGKIWKSTDVGLTWNSADSPDGGANKNWVAIDVSSTGDVVIGTWSGMTGRWAGFSFLDTSFTPPFFSNVPTTYSVRWRGLPVGQRGRRNHLAASDGLCKHPGRWTGQLGRSFG